MAWSGFGGALFGPANAPQVVNDVLDAAVIDGHTARQLLGAMARVLLGKVSGSNSNSPVFRDLLDTKNAISATTDSSGNRTSVTVDWE